MDNILLVLHCLIIGLSWQYNAAFPKNEHPLYVSKLGSSASLRIAKTISAFSYGLKPKLNSMMVGFVIPLSSITIAFWYFIVKTF